MKPGKGFHLFAIILASLGGCRGRVGFLLSAPKYAQGTMNVLFGFLGGGEYFFDDKFSMGVEGQLNASISNKNSTRFGNPGGININTAAAVFMTVYF